MKLIKRKAVNKLTNKLNKLIQLINQFNKELYYG